MFEYKTTVAPVWGWWGGGHTYPGDGVSPGQGELRKAIDDHVQREAVGGWELISMNHFDQASEYCVVGLWKRPQG